MKIGDRVQLPAYAGGGPGTIVGVGRGWPPNEVCEEPHECWEVRADSGSHTHRADVLELIDSPTKKEDEVTQTERQYKAGDLVRFNDNLDAGLHSISRSNEFSGKLGVVRATSGVMVSVELHESEAPLGNGYDRRWYWTPEDFTPFELRKGDRVRIKVENWVDDSVWRNQIALSDLEGVFEGTVSRVTRPTYSDQTEVYVRRPGQGLYWFEPEDLEFLGSATPVVIPTDLPGFKAHIREVTKRYAEENDFCELVDDFLGELGIDPIMDDPTQYTIKLTARPSALEKITDLFNSEDGVVDYYTTKDSDDDD